jgi:UDP-N-acetylglucosamine kinase
MNAQSLTRKAIAFVKANKTMIKQRFAGDQVCLQERYPISIFMAGGPGAGKTEFSKRLISILEIPMVRIDADEIREIIPGYCGANSSQFQRAAALGIEYILDHALQRSKNLILDGTMADLNKVTSNIERSLRRGRMVDIYYLFQDPLLAWTIAQNRAKIERRIVPKEFFIESFIKAKENVEEMMKKYSDKIRVSVVMKNNSQVKEKTIENVIDLKMLPIQPYNYKYLKDNLQ